MRGGLEIIEICGRKIYDGSGHPTIEAEVILENGAHGRAAVPSAGFAGRNTDFRDEEAAALEAVDEVNHKISEALLFEDASDQWYVDQLLLEAGCKRTRTSGSSPEILAVSMAVARAAGAGLFMPLFRYLGGAVCGRLPLPVMTMIEGRADQRFPQSNQPFMDIRSLSIVPLASGRFAESLRMGTEVYHTLKKLLITTDHKAAVGDQGGFFTDLKSTEEALQYIMDAMRLCGYEPGADFSIALDGGGDDLYDKENDLYVFQGEKRKKGMEVVRNSREMTEYYRRLTDGFPIDMIEAGLHAGDWEGWTYLTQTLGHKVRIAGGRFIGTDKERLEKGIREGAANAVMVNMLQAGTVSGTIEFIDTARAAGWSCILAGETPETEDAFLADLAAAAGAVRIKLGAPCRTEQAAKYNELLRIEEFF